MSYTMKIFDAGRSMLAKKAINSQISQFGEVVEMNINTNIHKITAKILLKGEDVALELTIKFYEVIQQDSKNFITMKGFESSKEWLTIVLNRFLNDKQIPIPDEATFIL